MTNVAVSCAELTDWAELTACETEGIVRENNLGRAIPVLVLDVIDESLDVDGG